MIKKICKQQKQEMADKLVDEYERTHIKELINKIPGHHLALVYTDLINYLTEFSRILNINYIKI